MGEGLRDGRRRRARPEAGVRAKTHREPDERPAGARGRSDRHEARGPLARHAPDPRRARALRGCRRERERGSENPPRIWATPEPSASCSSRASDSEIRARGSEPDVAVGLVHVPLEAAAAPLRGRVHGRSLALRRLACGRASPEVRARDGGARARTRGVRGSDRGAHRQRAAVHGVAWRDRLRAGASPQRDPSREESASASGNAREGGAILEDALGRVPLAHGVLRLRGLHAKARDVHRRVQLPASAPGAARSRSGGPLLPRGAARARGGAGEHPRQRDARGARAAAAQAVLPRRSPRRSGPVHQHRGPLAARAPRRRRAADDRATEGR